MGKRILVLLVWGLVLGQTWLGSVGAAGNAKSITGLFVGCGMGQGMTECRIIGLDGKDYYISHAEGGIAQGNAADEVFEAVDEEAWSGKTVELKAVLETDGDIKRLLEIRLAERQVPELNQLMQKNQVLMGVISESSQAFFLQTKDGRYELSPGQGYHFGDIAELMRKHKGRELKLRGDILKEKGNQVFIVTSFKP